MTTGALLSSELDQPIPTEEDPQTRRIPWGEIAVAAAAFVAFCVVVLVRKTVLMEPDDLAYRASIVALSQGHLALTTAQYHALARQVGGIAQWVHLPDGRWMSEKNPGYPFYAVIFYWLHALRLAPLFAGGLASISLFVAARRWLGRWAGTWAVVLFLASGMALAFAFRATMPTFTDASFIAAGAGAILWAMISTNAPSRRRTAVGLVGFLGLELATFMRYTDVVMLIVACAAVVIAYKPARLRVSMVAWWLGSVALFGSIVLLFDTIFYGHPTKTGYADGEITFSTSATVPNLKHMPELLLHSVPAILLAGAALIWMAVRVIRSRLSPTTSTPADAARRDGLVGIFLAAGWLGEWALYMAYTWTAQMGGGGHGGPGGGPGGGGGAGGGGAIHLIRFYVPAIGLIALLAAWFVMQLPRWAPPLIALLAIGTAYGSFHSLIAGGSMGIGGGLPGGIGGGSGFGHGGLPQGAGQGSPLGGTSHGGPPSGALHGTPPKGGHPPTGFGGPPSGAGAGGTPPSGGA